MKLSICGLDCNGCDFYPTDCEGCREVKGKPFWTETGCELFNCCSGKEFTTCGDCDELPCKMFIELKDPNISQEEHLKEVKNRVNRLLSEEFVEKAVSPAKWHYDELKQVGVDYADKKQVEEYDSGMRDLRDIKKEIREISTAINLKAEQAIIEIGTGTGEFAIEMSKYCKKVIALDVSRTMLDFAKEKARKRKRSNLEFIQGGFLTYNHQGESVDAVITQLALHHLPDFWKMVALKRISDMLKDGGKLYLRDVVFPSNVEDYDVFFNNILNKLKVDAGFKIAEETRIHIKEEFSTFDWIMESLLTKAGFTIDKVNYFNGFLATYVCTKKKSS